MSEETFKPIKTLPVNFTLGLLEKYQGENLISLELEREQRFLKNMICIQCNSKSLIKGPKIINGEVLFGDILPQILMRCSNCNCEFDPYTQLITKV